MSSLGTLITTKIQYSEQVNMSMTYWTQTTPDNTDREGSLPNVLKRILFRLQTWTSSTSMERTNDIVPDTA
jgi:hypothetical protein